MSDAIHKPVMATKKRAMLLGAEFIENDLAEMRTRLRREEEDVQDYRDRGNDKAHVRPVTTSHEGDMLKATEWASAATWLRALADQEER